MKTNYCCSPSNYSKICTRFLLLLIFSGTFFSLKAQNDEGSVSNDRLLKKFISIPGLKSMMIEPGYYPSVDRFIGEGVTIYKPAEEGRSITGDCIYAIQQSGKCFGTFEPGMILCDTARVFTLDPTLCGCCPPNDAGTWSYISGPGNVTFGSLTDDTTEFCVDEPGVYTLRYTWPAPWNSQAETQFLFFGQYAVILEATDDTCGLSAPVHFEYTSTFGDPNATLTWTLNGEGFDGPDINPAGDTLDFLLTVPTCGEYTLEATLTTSRCAPVIVSVTIEFHGESGPEIIGVGPDTTIICPDEPVFSEPTAYDPCDPDPVLTFETDTIPGDCPDSYTVIRTWTAVNSCNDTTTATQVIVHLPNPNPEILSLGFQIESIGDTVFAGCEGTSLPFPEIETPCGPAEVDYTRSDGGEWGDPFGPGTTEVCYWGISPCGYSTDTICFPVIVEQCGEQFCSLTQGFYGNQGGTFCNGMGTVQLINSLLAQGNLVVGSSGNTMTFFPGEAGCIIDLLPGGGPAKKITGANTCANHPGIQTKKGRIHNILLAQTITLGLNLRLSSDLGNLEIFSETLETAPSSGCDEEGDTVTGPLSQYVIPTSVYNVLSLNGTIIPNVNDLYALANTGLGGGSVGATSLTAIADAVSRINEGFDECAFGGFVIQPLIQSAAVQGESIIPVKVTSLSLNIYPNPFQSIASIGFIAPVSGNVSVEVYTLTGKRVAVLHEGYAEAGKAYQYSFAGDPGVNNATYICVIRTEKESKYERLILSR